MTLYRLEIKSDKNSSVGRTKQIRLMLESKCVVSGKKKFRFIKNH